MSSRPPHADPDSTAVISPVPTDGSDGPDKPGDPPVRHGRRRRWRRVLVIVLAAVLLLVGGGALAATLYVRSVDGDIERIEAFDAVPEAARPPKVEAAKDALNFLVLGSDSRDPANASGSRSDTIILLHLTKDRSSAQMVSIPRDTWLHVPPTKDGKRGDADAKINAAFAWGGVPLMVQTVESYTKVRIDHVAMVDFAGFKEIVDALGGVEIDVEESFTSTHSLNPDSIRHFRKGPQTMDGAAALDYARERFAFKDGDFARIRHQQQVIKAILNKASSGGILTNPGRLNGFLRATADAVAVDGTLNLFDMAMELRHLRSDNLSFFTSPSKGTGMVGDQSVVLPDPTKARELFDAVRRDDVAALTKAGG
ncbi:LCP family protein [Asanoa sp. WMMD1127]|uniref:LCP family protein n=1 Tax=Asanoa sp. WMMD1127 TaxID=3016107 RepID=UPI0024172120|nr:LCP family protein [Asanoa sp. WMMD1127]MDG4825201.1 LCP family protein [Asanoa sp. WMMD1127]